MSKNVPAYMFTIKSMRVRGSDEQSEQLYIYQGVYIYIYRRGCNHFRCDSRVYRSEIVTRRQTSTPFLVNPVHVSWCDGHLTVWISLKGEKIQAMCIYICISLISKHTRTSNMLQADTYKHGAGKTLVEPQSQCIHINKMHQSTTST